MATHDYNIANQTGADFRADLNNALLAIVSNNSNATSPSTTYAYQLWVDTANNVLKLRNSANSDWITTGISITASNSFTGDITGNSATATALATARTINGVSFDGTANISFNTDSVSEGSSNLYFTNERVDDQVNSLLTAGSGISLTYDDAAGTLTIANTNSADITSVVAGDGLTGGGTSGDVTLAVSVDDSSIEINSDTLRVKASGITNAMLAGSIANDKLAGSIANSKLANSSVTINSQAISLGGSHTFDSDDIGEGSSNLYFTNARARGSLSIGSEGSASGNGAIAYNSSTGVFTYTPPVISGLSGNTDDLSEGSSNLYYTDTRSNAAIDARVTNTFINNLSGVVADTTTALATARSIALSGDVTASGVSFDGTGDITLSTTISANSVALGTDTTGNYVATIADAGNSRITVANSGSETAAVTLDIADDAIGTDQLANNAVALGTQSTGNYVAGISGTTNEIEVSGSGSETASVTIGLPDNVTIAGDLTVNGTTTTVNTSTLEVEDPLIKLAKANSGADSVDIGFYGLYDTSGSQDLYAGLFRDASDSGKFKLFKDLQAEPTTTVNTSGTGYAVGTLVSNLEGDVTGNVTGNVSGTAATVTGAAQTNITSLGTLTGLTTTGDVNLGDDDKVIFGAGSDLQIFHDGSNSFVKDAGTGNLKILADNLLLQRADESQTYIQALTGGGVDLRHAGNVKLATTSSGVDVTGTLTASTNLEAGSSGFLRFVAGSSTTPSILFGDSSGTGGTLSFKRNADSAVAMSIDATGTLTATTLAGTLSTAAQTNITSVGTLTTLTVDDITIDGSTISDSGNLTIDAGADIILDVDGADVFFKDNGTTFGQIRNASNNLRIQSSIQDADIVFRGDDGGTNVTALTLDMSDAGAATFNAGITSGNIAITTTGSSQISLLDSDNGFAASTINVENGGRDLKLTTPQDTIFVQGSTESMRILDGGNVGIGTTSPATDLHISSATPTITFTDTDNNYDATIAGLSGSLVLKADANAEFGTETIQFHTGGSQRATIDSSGNVGIGTSSPDAKLQIMNNDGSSYRFGFGGTSDVYLDADNVYFRTDNGGANTAIISTSGVGIGTSSPDCELNIVDASTPTLRIKDTTNNCQLQLYAQNSDAHIGTSSNHALIVDTNDTESARFHTDGHFLIGTTTNQGVGGISFQHASSGVNIQQNSDSTSGGYEFYVFRRNSTQIGSINQSSTNAVTYNTSSDARLKDVTGSARGLDVINNLNPVAYNWKADNHADEGLIAQEVEKLVPNAVNQDEDGYYSMDYSKLVTHLVKGMQEQQEQIESLKSEIANLKGE